MTQLNFNVVCTTVDLLQVTQEHSRCAVQDLEQETGLFKRIERRNLIRNKRIQHFRFFEADRNKEVRRQEDTKRHCIVHIVTANNWNVDNNEDIIVL